MYNVMVADDEYIIRQGVINLINWEELNCRVVCEAAHGQEAVARLNESDVDILLCDIRMPGKSGLEVAQWAHANMPQVKVVLLTAHSDFQYAKQAICYGVADYVIKTNYIEKLPEVIARVVSVIEEERTHQRDVAQLRERLKESDQLLQEKLVGDILSGVLYEKDEVLTRADGCGFPNDPFVMLSFIFDRENVRRIGESRRGKMQRALKNYINLSCTEHLILTVPLRQTEFAAVLFLNENDEPNQMDKLLTQLESLRVSMQETLGVRTSICVSDAFRLLSDMPQAYQQAKELNARAAFFEMGCVSAYAGVCAEGVDHSHQLDQHVSAVLVPLEEGRYDDLSEKLNSFFQEAGTGGYTVIAIKNRTIDICSACVRGLYSLRTIEPAARDWPTYQRFVQCDSVTELRTLLSEVIDQCKRLCERKQAQGNPFVRQCRAYLLSHYGEKISLSTIAESLHINKSYLSSLFKKETGTSLIEALTRIRLENAIQLMQNPDIKLFEVAERVGFEDAAYFSNVFTKYMGISPGTYRNRR